MTYTPFIAQALFLTTFPYSSSILNTSNFLYIPGSNPIPRANVVLYITVSSCNAFLEKL